MATSIKQIYPIPTSFRPRRQFRGVETSNVYKTINITLEKKGKQLSGNKHTAATNGAYQLYSKCKVTR